MLSVVSSSMRKMLRRSGVYGSLSMLVCCGLLACTQVEQAKGETMLEVTSPDGAVAPEGISKIKKGMSQDDVLKILTSLYTVEHSALARPLYPINDVFAYRDGGTKKYIEIFYRGEYVSSLRFGYKELFSFE